MKGKANDRKIKIRRHGRRPDMKRRAPIWKALADDLRAQGKSYRDVAETLGVPMGTVKAWVSRRKRGDVRADMQPGMQPPAAKGKTGDMQPGMQPAGPAMFRGVTARDMPGKTRMQQSMNFAALKRGDYPPRSWQVPGYLVGRELVEAMEAACVKWRKPKGGTAS